MSDTERNALAELAETLHTIAATTDTMFPNAIGKASRIVAELAKVECQPPDYLVPYDGLAYTAYAKCRAIAEEGCAK